MKQVIVFTTFRAVVRKARVALAADIEKAFLMVSIAKQDQDVLRFL